MFYVVLNLIKEEKKNQRKISNLSFFHVQKCQALFINTFIIDKNAGNNYPIIIIGKKAVISKITGQNTKQKTIIMEQL